MIITIKSYNLEECVELCKERLYMLNCIFDKFVIFDKEEYIRYFNKNNNKYYRTIIQRGRIGGNMLSLRPAKYFIKFAFDES